MNQVLGNVTSCMHAGGPSFPPIFFGIAGNVFPVRAGDHDEDAYKTLRDNYIITRGSVAYLPSLLHDITHDL